MRGLASRRDLYTLPQGDQELDEFERWFECEYETPAQEAIDRAVSGQRLRRDDWQRLVLYCLAQDLRTPRTYHQITSRFAEGFDETFRTVVRDFKKAVQRGDLATAERESAPPDVDQMTRVVRVTVNPDAFPERDEGQITVRALAGRRLWLSEVRRLATGRVRSAALGHEWSIAEPADGMTWITSDHPVVRLNYYGATGTYDLSGGWGRRNGNILMPLSPRHLLFTEIGKRQQRRFAFPREATALLRRVLVESALDDVFADAPYRDVVMTRPRTVDADKYAQRETAWASWHENQNRAESEFSED